jgi:hypothetical protein
MDHLETPLQAGVEEVGEEAQMTQVTQRKPDGTPGASAGLHLGSQLRCQQITWGEVWEVEPALATKVSSSGRSGRERQHTNYAQL